MNTIRSRITCLAALSTVALLSACEHSPTRPQLGHYTARLTGRALRADGTPAAGAVIFVGFRASALLLTLLPIPYADDRGEFSFVVEVLGATPRLSPDTVSAGIGVVDQARRTPSGEAPTVIDTVLFTLSPEGRTPVTTSLTLRLPAQ